MENEKLVCCPLKIANFFGIPLKYVKGLYEQKDGFPAEVVNNAYMIEPKELKEWMNSKYGQFCLESIKVFETIIRARKNKLIDESKKKRLCLLVVEARTTKSINCISEELATIIKAKNNRKKDIAEETIVRKINNICKVLNEILFNQRNGLDRGRTKNIITELRYITQKIELKEL